MEARAGTINQADSVSTSGGPDAIALPSPTDHGGGSHPAVGAPRGSRNGSKLRQAEGALRASEPLYRSVVDNLAKGVVVQDAAGRIVASNPAAREILGLTVDQLTGLTSFDPQWHAVWADGTPTNGKDHPATIVRTTGRAVTDVVMGVRHSSGVTRWLQVSARPLRESSEDRVTGVVVSFLDVTERRRVDQALRDAEALLNQTQALTQVGGWAYDVAASRVIWTDEVYRIHELPHDYDPNSAEQDIEFYAPVDRARIAEAFRLSFEEGRPYDLELRLVTAKGREIWVRSVGQPQVEDGRVVRVYGTIADITEQRRADEELRILDHAIQSQSSGFAITDLQGNLTRVNAAFLRLVGCEIREEVLGRQIFEFCQQPDDAAQAIRTTVDTGVWTGEIEAKRRDGSSFTARLTVSLVKDNDAQPFCLTALLDDATESNLAAQLVRTARTRLEEAQGIAHVGSWDWDPVVDEISGSDEFFRLFDAVPADLTRYGQFAERVHPDDRDRVDRDVADALEEKRRYDTEYRVKLGDGGWRDINARGHLVTDADGKPVRLVGTVLDITERKRVEAALLQSERWYRTLADSLPHLVWTCQAEGPCDYLSPRWVAYTGIPESEQLGYRWLEQLHPDDRDRVITEWTAVAVRGESFDIEFRIRRADGVFRWFKTRAIPFRGNDGTVVKWFGSNTDIDDSKRAEQEVRALNAELEERVRLRTGLIEASLDPLLTISREGFVTDANAATEEVTGVPRKQLIGTEFADYFTEPERARSAYRAVIADGTVRDYPLSIRHVSGRTTEVLCNAALYANAEGEVQGVFAAARDVTERNRAEETVRVRTIALEAANRELEAFSYSVSHDLRAPLRSIDGFSRILVQEHADKLDPEAQRLLGVVVRNVGQMGVLIDDLLAFSRVARQELESRPVEMGRLARSVADELGAAEPGRRIEFDIDDLCAVPGDPALLRQVWTNLLGNAAKFTRPAERPRIEIRCEQGSGECGYTVRDNGVGFDPAYAGNLFKPFQRLHPTAEFEGTGIGLAIVARIVQRHGGRVWAEGAPAAGATFGFSLPTRREMP